MQRTQGVSLVTQTLLAQGGRDLLQAQWMSLHSFLLYLITLIAQYGSEAEHIFSEPVILQSLNVILSGLHPPLTLWSQ